MGNTRPKNKVNTVCLALSRLPRNNREGVLKPTIWVVAAKKTEEIHSTSQVFLLKNTSMV
jgi:hypothetical protein